MIERKTYAPKSSAALRIEAEDALNLKGLETYALSESDQLALLHELQVHQIELELQNEELSQAYLEAQALQEKYLDLYDFAPVGYFTLSTTGVILGLNLCAASMLKKERSLLMNRQIRDFVAPESLEMLNRFLEAANENPQDCLASHITLQRGENDNICIEIRGRPFDTDFNNPEQVNRVRVVMMDVSALKFATDELQNSFQKFFQYWRP